MTSGLLMRARARAARHWCIMDDSGVSIRTARQALRHVSATAGDAKSVCSSEPCGGMLTCSKDRKHMHNQAMSQQST
jgi:hypothetical protein